ncbi:MAG: hypothetical protein WAK91_03935 [Candidatus Acidiferrales bacterium]
MYPPEAISALKDALKSIFWYKDDLRLFLNAAELPPGMVANQGWHDPQEYKVRIIGKILDGLMGMGEGGIGPVRRLIQAVLDIPNFDHLRNLDDGAAKVQSARRAVEQLRSVVARHDDALCKRPPGGGHSGNKIMDAVTRHNDELTQLGPRFAEIVALQSPQARGFALERFLHDMFSAYDMNPRGSFKITGEQIDGAFEFDSTQFLLEVRWENRPQSTQALDSFTRKLERKLENTLGLFISLPGFTEEGLAAFRGGRPAAILMDGEDLALVLQGLIDFRELLKQKIRHASQTGNPYLRARDANK